MFHGHVKALFQHGAFHVDIASGADLLLGGTCMVEGGNTLLFESPVACIEYHSCFHVLAAWLVVGLRTRSALFRELVMRILAWTRLVYFQ